MQLLPLLCVEGELPPAAAGEADEGCGRQRRSHDRLKTSGVNGASPRALSQSFNRLGSRAQRGSWGGAEALPWESGKWDQDSHTNYYFPRTSGNLYKDNLGTIGVTVLYPPSSAGGRLSLHH